MDKEYIIKGNSAIMKCSVPSFVSDYVSVVSWVDENGIEYKSTGNYSDSKKPSNVTCDSDDKFDLSCNFLLPMFE